MLHTIMAVIIFLTYTAFAFWIIGVILWAIAKVIIWFPSKSAAMSRKRLAKQGVEITAEQKEEMAGRGIGLLIQIIVYLSMPVALYLFYLVTSN